jgi:hypothetical protein
MMASPGVEKPIPRPVRTLTPITIIAATDCCLLAIVSDLA